MDDTSGSVVIFGSTGFLGKSLARNLAKRGVSVNGFGSANLDLLRPEAFAALNSIDVERAGLVYASALTPDKGVTLETMFANMVMAANVAAYLKRHTFARCLFISTDAVYGSFGLNGRSTAETTPIELPTLYTVGKYACERILQNVAEGMQTPLLIVRPCAMFGPGDPHGSYGPNNFVHAIVAGQPIQLFGDGEERRDHLYVEDAAQIVVDLVLSNETGILNVATGDSRSFSEVADTLRRLAPQEVNINHLPRRGAITHQRFDIRRLKRAVPGVRFTPFADALRKTLQSALSAG
jgi:nucleoside-diphosphate-sugar epimerase